jgi:AraC-like DNA-binding protein
MNPRSTRTRVVQTTDLDEAEAVLAAAYLPVRLHTNPGRTLDSRFSIVELGAATVGALRFGTDVRVVTADAVNFHVNVPLSGCCVSGSGTREEIRTAPGTAQAFTPGAAADLRWTADTRQVCLMLDRREVERQLERYLGHDLTRPLVFAPVLDLRSPDGGGRTWLHILRLVDHEMRRDTGLLDFALSRQTIERLLIESLLTGHRHNYSDALATGDRHTPPSRIRRLVDMIDAAPEHPWTTAALSDEAGLSSRALQAGFRALVGMGPMSYVRAARLDRVRAELIGTDGTATVAQIARRWGFVHLGRFASAYAARHGELPSETLRRARPS